MYFILFNGRYHCNTEHYSSLCWRVESHLKEHTLKSKSFRFYFPAFKNFAHTNLRRKPVELGAVCALSRRVALRLHFHKSRTRAVVLPLFLSRAPSYKLPVRARCRRAFGQLAKHFVADICSYRLYKVIKNVCF